MSLCDAVKLGLACAGVFAVAETVYQSVYPDTADRSNRFQTDFGSKTPYLSNRPSQQDLYENNKSIIRSHLLTYARDNQEELSDLNGSNLSYQFHFSGLRYQFKAEKQNVQVVFRPKVFNGEKCMNAKMWYGNIPYIIPATALVCPRQNYVAIKP